MAVIKPYDASQLGAIEKAIRDSDLGVNPTNDGMIIRVVFPQLTEERRRELVKVARHKGEEAQGLDPLDPPPRQGHPGQARQGRRGRRGRRAPRGGRAGEADRASTRPPSTRWSSTRKPNSSRSDGRRRQRIAEPAAAPRHAGRARPLGHRRARVAGARADRVLAAERPLRGRGPAAAARRGGAGQEVARGAQPAGRDRCRRRRSARPDRRDAVRLPAQLRGRRRAWPSRTAATNWPRRSRPPTGTSR